ncbi:hypothetical protein [Streptomyces sp. NPDC093225]|uniref:hypothetical protein n=1 Tax=Streptomyces sp. NPDC093225 TaxID=3366034 RepID=UPI0037F97AD0
MFSSGGRTRSGEGVRTGAPARRTTAGAARAAGVAVTGAAVLLGVLGAAPAQAASGCAGRLMKALPFSTGTTYVYKTRTHACAVTIPRRPGGRQQMSVSIQPRGGVPVSDSGRFTRLAGPVTVYALTRCVYVRGAVGAGSVASGWILC